MRYNVRQKTLFSLATKPHVIDSIKIEKSLRLKCIILDIVERELFISVAERSVASHLQSLDYDDYYCIISDVFDIDTCSVL